MYPLEGDAVVPTDPRTAASRPSAIRMRASDADRQATVRVLQDGIARGLLNPVEGSERMSSAFAAVHLVDLEPLTADLPAPPDSRGSGQWGPQLTMSGEQLRAWLRTGIGGNRAAQLGAVLLLLVVLLTVGTAMMHILLAGGGHGGGPGPGGFGHH